jgi:Arc/MetJ-type ribon-helix-helix transcriptional regulator
MSRIEIDLPESLRAYVDRVVSEGGYTSTSDFIQSLVEAHRDDDRWEQIELALMESVDGPFEPLSDGDFGQIIAEGTRRLGNRQKK